MAGMNRRTLTAEEKGESARLTDFWIEFQEQNPGATQSWLASASGLGTQGAVSQYLRGVIPLNLHALLSICRVIQADPYYVSPRLMKSLTDVPEITRADPPKYLAEPQSGNETEPAKPRSPFRRVEAVGNDDPRFTLIPKVKLRLTAGITGFSIEPEEDDGATTAVPTEWIAQRGYSSANLVAIEVRGESMEPTFYQGDLVVLNTADTRPADGGVFAINYEGEPVVKRMSRDAGDWWLTSDNADQRKYGRKICRGDACLVIGRVVRRETERF